MLLSRLRPKKKEASQSVADTKEKKKNPELAAFLDKRDYTGAISLLKFQRQAGKGDITSDLWLAFCAFHAGDYRMALDEYEKMMQQKKPPPEVFTFAACCQFFLGMYQEAKQTTEMGSKSPLQNRLLFHVSHKLTDEKRLMQYHAQLKDVLEDQLCLAAIHYLRSHYQEAIDIYKKYLLSNRNFIALNVYLALCYYKLDYYDVSLEVLQVYTQQYPDSAIAVNLRACNHYKLYNGKAAEGELRTLQEKATPAFQFAKDVVQHNLVVFRNGEAALQHLPALVDVIPEARLNLVIYYLNKEDVQSAYNLMDDVEPTTPQEYILKGIVHCLMGQNQMNKEYLKTAQEFFRLVGGSAAECDTIPGRQCMASALFLQHQFDEAMVYLQSVKSYFYNEDTFNYNLGQALVMTGNSKEAEEVFNLIQNEKLKSDYTLTAFLARTYIMNKKSKHAWDLYLKMETSPESFSLLQLIANDCYKMGQFYYACKSFDVLERLDPNPEYWEGKRGAAVGVFQLVIAGREPPESLRDIVHLLSNTSHPQVDNIIAIMQNWARDNHMII